MATKIISEVTLQKLLQLIAVEIKGKADATHTHDYVTTAAFTAALDKINSFEVAIVDTLPSVSDAKEHTIYFVPITNDSDPSDIHEEYMLIGGKLEKIGDTKVDLSEYATIDYVTQAIAEELANYAASGHTHEIADVNGLQDALNGKANATHEHTIANVTGLQTALDGKSNTGHKHVKADITDFNESDYAEATHTHSYNDLTDKPTIPTKVSQLENDSLFQTKGDVDTAIANAVTGGSLDLSDYVKKSEFNTAMSGKADVNHTHEIADVTGLETRLTTIEGNVSSLNTGKADKDHDHTIEDVTGLQTQLTTLQTNIDGKADASHTHTIANVTGLQTALDGKSNTGHKHVVADITDITISTESDAATMWANANTSS